MSDSFFKNSVKKLANLAGDKIHPDGMESLLRHLSGLGFRPSAVLDVGANRASWSRLSKRVFPLAACHLVEPQTEMKPFLEAFCREHADSRWIQAGAAAEISRRILTIWNDLAGSSFLPAPDPRLENEGRQRVVEMVTIDSLIERDWMPVPELVKMDIQGYELEALKGAQKLFGKTEVILLEVSFFRSIPGWPLFHEIVAYLADKQYVAYDFTGFLKRPHDGALGQADVCFVRKDGPFRAYEGWE